MNRTERLTALLTLLQSRHPDFVRAGEIARHFGLSRRTVLRDMASLGAMDVPLEARDGTKGGYRLSADYRPPAAALPLTPHEASLLLIALRGLGRVSSLPFGKAHASLTAKVRALLGGSQRKVAEGWAERLFIDVPERGYLRTPFLDDLVAALSRGGWVSVAYASERGGEAVHTLRPQSLSTSGGFWYCRAYSREREAERTFRVDRFVSVAPCDAPADAPRQTAPDYEDPAHPKIRALLSPAGATFAEGETHLGHRVQRESDGSATLTFRCPPGELDYWARYFFRLGPDAVVCEPPELRARLCALAEKVLCSYAER